MFKNLGRIILTNKIYGQYMSVFEKKSRQWKTVSIYLDQHFLCNHLFALLLRNERVEIMI